jgi:hypothetical protein
MSRKRRGKILAVKMPAAEKKKLTNPTKKVPYLGVSAAPDPDMLASSELLNIMIAPMPVVMSKNLTMMPTQVPYLYCGRVKASWSVQVAVSFRIVAEMKS